MVCHLQLLGLEYKSLDPETCGEGRPAHICSEDISFEIALAAERVSLGQKPVSGRRHLELPSGEAAATF